MEPHDDLPDVIAMLGLFAGNRLDHWPGTGIMLSAAALGPGTGGPVVGQHTVAMLGEAGLPMLFTAGSVRPAAGGCRP